MLYPVQGTLGEDLVCEEFGRSCVRGSSWDGSIWQKACPLSYSVTLTRMDRLERYVSNTWTFTLFSIAQCIAKLAVRPSHSQATPLTLSKVS
jgi:hypothetical protein